jgi:hypothetical protein
VSAATRHQSSSDSARSPTFFTVCVCHHPSLAVATPRAFNASAKEAASSGRGTEGSLERRRVPHARFSLVGAGSAHRARLSGHNRRAMPENPLAAGLAD